MSEDEPPPRPSGSLSLDAPPTYPDDGPVSAGVRKLDGWIGTGEHALLFAILAFVVIVATTHAILQRFNGQGLWWSFDVIRGGTFSIGFIGAAFAMHQSRQLAMDLVSRRLPPRGRLVLSLLLALFTIAITIVLARSGLHQVEQVETERGRHLFEKSSIVLFLPIGCALICLHAALHAVIDVDYLIRNKLPPERARSGH